MKQITIYELLPLLKKGWVAMDKDGRWYWYSTKPRLYSGQSKWKSTCYDYIRLNSFEMKDFIPFDGDWKDSLIKVEHLKKKSTDIKDFELCGACERKKYCLCFMAKKFLEEYKKKGILL